MNDQDIDMQRRSAGVLTMAREATSVLLAILVAFGLDAWWDGRVERARTDGLLSEIAVEFQAAIVQLDSIIGGNERAENGAYSFVAASATAPRDSADFVGGLLEPFQTLSEAQFFDPSFGALKSLLSSGGVENVRNPDLRRRLADWPGRLTELVPETRWLDLAVIRLDEALASEGLFFVSNGPPLERLSRADVAQRMVSPTMREAVFLYGRSLSQYTPELRQLRDEAAAILEGLGAGAV